MARPRAAGGKGVSAVGDAPGDIPAQARDAIAALLDDPSTPVRLLISGGIGTGKSTALAGAREQLRGAGLTVLARPPRADDPPDAALVVDDAHLLTDDALAALTQRVADGAIVVVAAEPQERLRDVTLAIERDGRLVSLGPLPVAEELLEPTAGIPFLVRAVAAGAEPPAQAAKFALIDRLRRVDEPTLDTLLIMSLSQELGTTDVAAALDISTTQARRLVDRARAGGLVEPSHTPGFLRLVHDAIAHLIGNAHHREVETALVRSQLDLATVSTEFALRLAEHGLKDDRLAALLGRRADASRGDFVHAARLYRAAVDAGADGMASRAADALARAGDHSAAAALADGLLGSPDSAERAAAVRIAASLAVLDGNAGQAAELFRWLGPHPDAVVGAAAAIALTATGDLAAARVALRTQDAGPPTMAARGARSLAEGLLLSIDGPYSAAMAKLGQAIGAEPSMTEVLPDSPAALVALAAMHGGDPVRARSVIGRATGPEVAPMFQRRHALLSGWIKMQEGQLAAAGADVAAVGSAVLHRRDALWASALQTAIARRSGDAGALHQHWHAAIEVLAECAVDLFSLLPLGELWVAAARLRRVARLRHSLDEAFGLLESLGNPVMWSAPLHWAGVHAGILANSPESVAPHGQALGVAAADSTFARVLSGAGRTWLRVLADQVDADEVTVAARALSNAGLTSDATRLAGQAALQAADGRVSGAMLQLARDLKLGAGDGEMPSTEPAAAARSAPHHPAAGSALSDREREVAELLLLGMPYRDIGGRLYISAKTVEHHVARIRRRLGAGSRSEMLSMLRAMLAPEDAIAGQRDPRTAS